MSIIETLTEGIVNRNMEREGAALLNKWTQTGLLEGLTPSKQQTMAVLLENQAKSLLKEANSMSGGDIEGFAAVAFPIVRRVFAGLIANDLVSVQPMSLPSGLIFFLDFKFGSSIGSSTAETTRDRFGNLSSQSIYGTDRVGSQITGGVNLVGDRKEGFSGPGRDGQVGYAYASATGSHDIETGEQTLSGFAITNSMSEANKKKIKYDADLLTLADSATQHYVIEVQASKIDLANADYDNLSAFVVPVSGTAVSTNLVNATALGLTTSNTSQIRRLTRTDADEELFFYFVTTINAASLTGNGSTKLTIDFPEIDSYAEKSNGLGAINSFNFPLEGNEDIPEIDIKVDSIAITAQTKKLKAKWTPELGQDLNAYHNIDAEVELTSILSEQIALEIDREILADLVNGATAATYYWSRSPGLFVNKETGAELGATSAAPDFTGTVTEWYETLVETINDVSAQIHRKTLRGGATHVVCSPEVANILEFTAGFRANVTADADKGDIGAVKVGSLNRKFDVIVDPYFPRNVLLVARIGSSFLESGYVYAPYVPLQTTPTIFGVEDFVPRKGVMTRYAKKMVRPDMYGLVICRGLLGESGS